MIARLRERFRRRPLLKLTIEDWRHIQWARYLLVGAPPWQVDLTEKLMVLPPEANVHIVDWRKP